MTARKIVAKKTPSTKPATVTQSGVAKSTAIKKHTAAKLSPAIPKIVINSKPATKSLTNAKDVQPKKVKLIRDSFTMPSFDYDLIGVMKNLAASREVSTTNSKSADFQSALRRKRRGIEPGEIKRTVYRPMAQSRDFACRQGSAPDGQASICPDPPTPSHPHNWKTSDRY